MSHTAFLSGWRRQAHDPRDWHYVTPMRALAVMPPKVDLLPNMPPVLDQGDLGACGPNSLDECLEYDAKVQGFRVVSASRLFIYYVTRSMMSGQPIGEDSGVDNRTLLKAAAKYGICKESLWPYKTSKFKQKPPANCFTAAKVNRIKNYAVVPQTLTQMKGCLAGGFPFIFGFDVFASMMSDAVAKTGILPLPAAGDSPEGGHDVTIFGYDDTTGMFKFRNHWVNADGTPWGDNGNGYIPYEYATNLNLAGDFWTVNAIPAPLAKLSAVSHNFSGTLEFENGVLVSINTPPCDTATSDLPN